ncbi:MAG: hypothetical protein WC712_05070 [Candidatus Brocadiia bacterium]
MNVPALLLIPAVLFLQNSLGAPIGRFSAELYAILVLAIVLRTERGYRMPVAAILGLLADFFSGGRFAGFALSFSVAALLTSACNVYVSAENPVGRFFLSGVFLLASRAIFLVFADSSMTFSALPDALLNGLASAVANGVLAVFLIPAFASLVTVGKKSVTYSAES